MPATTGQILGKAHKLCEWLRRSNFELICGQKRSSSFEVAHLIERAAKWHLGNIENLPKSPGRESLDAMPMRLFVDLMFLEVEGVADIEGSNRIVTLTALILCLQVSEEHIGMFCFLQQGNDFSFLGACGLVTRFGRRWFHSYEGCDEWRKCELVKICHVVEQAMMAMHCTNVRSVDVFPPPALNKKRQQQGKPPLFTYKTLHVLAGDRSASHDKRADDAEAKRSPRLHFRRGHIRRISGDRMTWVQPCMVGDQRRGMVQKAYALVAQNKANKEGTKP